MNPYESRKRKRNPREIANIFSLLSFSYTQELFKKGYKRDLEDEDLYEVIKSCGSQKCGDKLEKEWAKENQKNGSPSIYRLLWKSFGLKYIIIGFVDLVFKVFNSIVMPYSTSKFVSFFKPGQTEVSESEAHFHTYIIMFLFIFGSFYSHNYTLWVEQFAIEIRTSFSSLLYRKSMKLTPSALSEISLGNIVTLITKDVYSFQTSIFTINDTWNGVVQTVIICYILHTQIGPVTFIGIGILLSAIPLQILIGKYISKLRLATSKKTDERLQLIQETLSAMRIIKMYTWEMFFGKQISAARKTEMNKMLYGFYLKVVIITIGITFSRLGFYALIISYIWMGYSTNTEMIFYMITLFKDLEYNLGTLIPWGMGEAAQFYSSLVRINRVLMAEELKPIEEKDEKTSKPFVKMEKASVEILGREILKDIDFTTNSGLTIITGHVGCGKSSFLKAILQDYPLSSGTSVSRGRISYASQDAWLFPSTIRQNIVFSETYNEKRYREIVRVCALEYDFNLLDDSDQTIVTDKGMNLSGGQQARINLARSIYRDSEIYLLDDSLTALDAHVKDYIFEECIQKYLSNKIVILVSQTAHHIQQADHVIVLDGGKIKSSGKPSKELLQEISTVITEDKEDTPKTDLEENEFEERIEEDAPLKQEQSGKRKQVYGEVKKSGGVDYTTYRKYFNFGGGIALMLLNVVVFGLAQGTESYSDMLLTGWVDEKEKVLGLQKNLTKLYGVNYSTVLSNDTEEIEELHEAISSEQFQIHLYSMMIFVSTAAALIKTYVLLSYCRRASINIHKSMLASILKAPMAFFDTHFIGNILNRFSQDMNNVDEMLPFVFTEVFRVFFVVAGIMYIITTVHWGFLMYISIFLGSLIILRTVYLPTGRSLKRLEASTRSPMIGHLNATLEGLTTLRACRAQDILTNEFDRHQDLFTSAHYNGLATSLAFAFVMDLCCTVFIISVVLRFAFFDSGTSVGDVGLAVTQVFMLSGDVDWGVKEWADLENLMTSVERILEYTDVKSETTKGKEMRNWPTEGSIEYENVSLTYNNKEMVLKDLSFKLGAKEKIGIVGRTGAGKSSIIISLFRLYDWEGAIRIDGVDLKDLSLQFLRKRIAIIPQDPILFSGTIRTNLDPLGEFKDEDLWKVLEKTNLKDSVSNLNMITSGSHSTMSSGEKQLLCLARAILTNAKIVILDEATANMDHETDALLNRCIKENFSECTMLTIAHRLESILECDRVMVLEKGHMKEFDNPKDLLSKQDGYFYKMVEQAGLLKDY